MNRSAAIPTSPPRPAWWRALHIALLPDYNRRAAVYWWSVVLLGGGIVLLSLIWLAQQPMAICAEAIGAVALAMIAGSVPIRVARSKNSFAAGEIFIFLSLLILGCHAAVLASAGEAAVGSWRTSKRWSSRIASPAMAALSMSLAGFALRILVGTGMPGASGAGLLMVSTMAIAFGYFILNTLLMTAVPRLKRNERLQWSDLFGVFGWIGLACMASAAVAALLFLTYRQSGVGVLYAMVPLLLMMLATLHYFFRQQEAYESVRLAGAEAAERENELAARHVQELEASERRFHSAFTHASIGMALLAFDGRILLTNPVLGALLGLGTDDLLHANLRDLVIDKDRSMLDQHLGRVGGREFEGFSVELRCHHSSGEIRWTLAHCGFFSEPGAASPCLILQLQDITARRQAEAGLQHIAFHDELTGLPNRRRFHELLIPAVERAQIEPASAFAVMFLDFDRFKLINDSLGHSAGDEFLVQVSRRIRDSLRPGDVVARLGGDEFAVLVYRLEHEGEAIALADRLMEAVRQPFTVAGTELSTSASIGITFSAFGYTSPDDMLRDADTAMYKAKAQGKARYALFDSSLHTEVAERLRLEGDLRRAIDDGLLTVAYQPVCELGSRRIMGFEALVRWQHPSDGQISPAAFLPIAEEAGLMLRLTDFVLHCACHQLREWQEVDPRYAELTMNVNVSGHDVAHSALAARVSRAIVESGIQAHQLCIELTENILMSQIDGSLPALAELSRLDVTLAIDDFGTGYSSLSHLSTLPIDCLKIDRSFVNRLGDGANEAAVVQSIILLGKSLGMLVVAEGIETASQLNKLCELGCLVGQGYLLDQPMTPAEVMARLMPAPPDSPSAPPQIDMKQDCLSW